MSVAATPRGRLRQVERWLKANFPTAFPVRVRVGTLRDKLGLTTRGKGYFTVSIAPEILLIDDIAAETLIHEYAHAFAWRPHLDGDPVFEVHHDDEWALAYGKMYRAYFDESGMADSSEFSPSPWS